MSNAPTCRTAAVVTRTARYGLSVPTATEILGAPRSSHGTRRTYTSNHGIACSAVSSGPALATSRLISSPNTARNSLPNTWLRFKLCAAEWWSLSSIRIVKAQAWSLRLITQYPGLLRCGILVNPRTVTKEVPVIPPTVLRHHKLSTCFLMRGASRCPFKSPTPFADLRKCFLGLSLTITLLFMTYRPISRHYFSLF
jgi:hypothetical protein